MSEFSPSSHTSSGLIASCLREGEALPPEQTFAEGIRRAPKRMPELSGADKRLALANALRYIPAAHHQTLAPEFLAELETTGRIYGYRFRPTGDIKPKPVQDYQGRCLAGKALQLMIDNNLSFEIALYPYELVTYGETGQVCQNWMQYRLIKRYLEQITEEQTLQLYSGHPVGLFASSPEAPRVIATNGLLIGLYNNPEDWARAQALGVSNYGQMTAGGWMYIGPQGIVHGTYNTLVIAGRKKLGLGDEDSLAGKLFVSSGLGGMSGAQGKAITIARCAGILAEVDESRIQTRKDQGWVDEVTSSAEQAFALAKASQNQGVGRAIAYHGNIVDLLQYAVDHEVAIDLISDQTSCHAAYEGGYCPQGISFAERSRLLAEDPEAFKTKVDESLRHHYQLICTLTERGSYFFDYGNAFLKSVYDAGCQEVAIAGDPKQGFRFQSYVEDLLGPELFDYGYGPFRWVCLSLDPKDLDATDQKAAEVIEGLRPTLRYQDLDNLKWVRDAGANRLVVGSQARILYSDAKGRKEIALAFNRMVRDGQCGPIMLGRDHHDTGGTDSPFRETANIKDGSNITADMATSVFAGNAARGMTMVALHNGGGVGIGKSINGGFGLVLDGSETTDAIIRRAISWDVMAGVTRRAWSGNSGAVVATEEFAADNPDYQLTMANPVDPALLDEVAGKPPR